VVKELGKFSRRPGVILEKLVGGKVIGSGWFDQLRVRKHIGGEARNDFGNGEREWISHSESPKKETRNGYGKV
jgi:hypothetical protein